MHKYKILVVDDELSIIKYLNANLREEGFEVFSAMNGLDALSVFEAEMPDIAIIDINMPGLNGFEVCRKIREWSRAPIIMLSARGDESDKVKCLDIGADDYVTKPFGIEELLARIRALLRRSGANEMSPAEMTFTLGDLHIDYLDRTVKTGKREITFTPTEYSLLEELAKNAGKVLTHTHLLSKIWGTQYCDEKEYLHVYIRRVRAKLEPDYKNPVYIQTVPGVGYRMNADVPEKSDFITVR